MPIEILLEKALSKKSIETAIDLYDVSSEFLIPIKRYLQQDPSSGTQAALYLISKLKSKSSARRAKIIFLMDYLLCRCQSFRNKLLVDVSFVNEVLEDSQTDEPMKTQFMQLLELWDLKYGRSYPSMRCLCRYLRETVRVVTVDVVEEAEKFIQDSKEREKHRYDLIDAKRRHILSTYKDILREIRGDTDSVTQCFALIFPSFVDDDEPKRKHMRVSEKSDNLSQGSLLLSSASSSSSLSTTAHILKAATVTANDDDDVQWEDGSDLGDCSHFRQFEHSSLIDIVNSASLGSENYEITVNIAEKTYHHVKSDNNEDILQTLKDSYNMLKGHYAKRVLDMKAQLREALNEDDNKDIPECTQSAEALKEIVEIEELLFSTLARLSHFFEPHLKV